jgi:hypothetical protein
MTPTAALLFLALACQDGTSYHVDSRSGDDGRSGTSPEQAWKTLERLHRETFKPGDRILFRAGSRFSGQFRPRGSGSAAAPVVVDRYDAGPRPRFDAEGKHLDAVLLQDVEYWELRGLEVTNQGPERAPGRTGVRLFAETLNPLRGIRLRNLHVHDVNSDLRKSHEGCGIFFESGAKGCFEDLLIEGCRVERVDRNGICQRSRGGPRSRKVVIRKNLLEDIGGDGIKPWGCDEPLVEHNVLRNGRMRCEDYAAGIWPWECDRALIQFNEVSGMRGTKDGQGFDSDALCSGTVFQYNYSHDNEGGFILLCATREYYCRGTVIRYNISQNDGVSSARVFHIGGPVRNSHIYNNTIYVGPKQDLPLVLFTEDGGWAEDTRFTNNIFYVDGRVTYERGKGKSTVFANNVLFGRHEEKWEEQGNITVAPPLRRPGSGGNGMDTLDGYRHREGSDPIFGKLVPGNGGRDFFGVPVPADRAPAVGASQAK